MKTRLIPYRQIPSPHSLTQPDHVRKLQQPCFCNSVSSVSSFGWVTWVFLVGCLVQLQLEAWQLLLLFFLGRSFILGNFSSFTSEFGIMEDPDPTNGKHSSRFFLLLSISVWDFEWFGYAVLVYAVLPSAIMAVFSMILLTSRGLYMTAATERCCGRNAVALRSLQP